MKLTNVAWQQLFQNVFWWGQSESKYFSKRVFSLSRGIFKRCERA